MAQRSRERAILPQGSTQAIRYCSLDMIRAEMRSVTVVFGLADRPRKFPQPLRQPLQLIELRSGADTRTSARPRPETRPPGLR
ncbi:hypothetical protein AAFF_G00234030 [Aldrovandia affinis]|uniref:Uncharacterized protein n=1 Tax=Aldrovandia affinis TaxID=143900 RepID=A0AAD7REI9_9TELE|nr:hypothetical protein AAFF_G00234030 [Aldrovandia affinis]